MDCTRFGALARMVGTWTTRRTALTLLAGLGLHTLAPVETAARKSGNCQPACNERRLSIKGKCKRKNEG